MAIARDRCRDMEHTDISTWVKTDANIWVQIGVQMHIHTDVTMCLETDVRIWCTSGLIYGCKQCYHMVLNMDIDIC